MNLRRHLRRPSPSLVISLIALVLATTGTAVASVSFARFARNADMVDGKHAVFGRVTEGMDVVDEISRVDTDSRDAPVDPVTVERVELL